MRGIEKAVFTVGCASYLACVLICSALMQDARAETLTESETKHPFVTAPLAAPTAQPTGATLVAPLEVEETQWAYPMRWAEYIYVRRVVMAESGNQPIEGQMAVAQCILDTSIAEGMTPYEVVVAPGQYADPYDGTVNSSVIEACARVFRDGETAVDEFIQWFYAPAYCYSEWHESKTYVTTIGGHRFFA